MIKENSYVNVQAFMVNDLNLGGNELIIFAVIFGFSQDGESWYTGSRAYLAEWCKASKKTVSNNLAKLCEKGFLEKRVRIESGVTFNDYRVGKKFLGVEKKLPRGREKTSTGGVEKTSPHTLEEDTSNTNNREKVARFTPPTIEEVKAYCQERKNGIDAEAFVDFYASKGWKVGSQPMKDWKACVRTWERRAKKDNKTAIGPNGVEYRTDDEDNDEIWKKIWGGH